MTKGNKETKETKETRAKRLSSNFTADLGHIYSVCRIKLAWYAIIQTEDRPVSVKFNQVGSSEIDLEVTASLAEFRPFLKPLMSEIVRNFINDIFNVTCSFNIFMTNLLKDKSNIFDFSDENTDMAISYLNKYLSKEQKVFVEFLRLVRNTMVHHEGLHNSRNKLNHEFMGRKFETTRDLLYKPVDFYLSEVIGFYQQTSEIFSFENLAKNSYFMSVLTK